MSSNLQTAIKSLVIASYHANNALVDMPPQVMNDLAASLEKYFQELLNAYIEHLNKGEDGNE